MKKSRFLFVLVLFGFVSALAFSVSPDFSFAFEPYFKINNGYAGEYLFNMEGTGKIVHYAPEGSKQISQLDWDVKSLKIFGNKIYFGYKDFQVRNTLEVGIPAVSGQMKDYDWNSTVGYQTHFSCHENELTKYFSGDLLLGWKINSIEEGFSLTPLLGFDFSRIGFVARNGYTQYVSGSNQVWSDDLEKSVVNGDIITYRQDRWLVKLGFESVFSVKPKFDIKADLFFCPVLNLNSYDSHLRKTPASDYLDYHMRKAFAVDGEIAFEYSVKDNLFFVLSVNGCYQNVATGDSYGKYSTDTAYGKINNSKGGANQWMIGTSLGVRYNFF